MSDEIAARRYLEKIIWGDTPICPHCYNKGGYLLKNAKTYRCADRQCRKNFTVTVKTIFEHTKLKLSLWIGAIYLCTIHKRGISSYQLAEDLKISQRTAWFMLHRIRTLFKEKAFELLNGVVEVDETFVGGKNKNRHFNKRVTRSQGRAFVDKTPVIGMLERGGRLVAKTIKDTTTTSVMPVVKGHIQKSTTVCTDEWFAYNNLYKYYDHHKVYHSQHQYTDGDVSTNGIESFWSQLKRGIIGIYYQVSRKHLQKYVDEYVFKYNARTFSTEKKLATAIVNCRTRLTYKDLVSSQS